MLGEQLVGVADTAWLRSVGCGFIAADSPVPAGSELVCARSNGHAGCVGTVSCTMHRRRIPARPRRLPTVQRCARRYGVPSKGPQFVFGPLDPSDSPLPTGVTCRVRHHIHPPGSGDSRGPGSWWACHRPDAATMPIAADRGGAIAVDSTAPPIECPCGVASPAGPPVWSSGGGSHTSMWSRSPTPSSAT
jgi:hypothetical protein